MKKLFIAVLLLYHCSAYLQSIAVKKKIDSLSNLLKEPRTDDEKIRIYYELSTCYFSDDVEKIKHYSELILKISQKNKSTLGMGLYYLTQRNINFINRESKKSAINSRKAYDLLKNTKETKYYLVSVISLGRSYHSKDEVDLLKKLLDSNYKLFHQFGDPKLLGDFYLFRGACFEANIDKRQTINYKKALYYYDLCNDRDGLVLLCYRIAKSYRRIKLKEEALKYLNKAIDLNPDKFLKNTIELEKAKVYNELGEFKNSKELTKKIQLYIDEFNLEDSDFNWMNLLAEARSDLGLKNYQEAIQKCKQILNTKVKSVKKITYLNALITISLCYHELGQNQTAMQYIHRINQLIDFTKYSTGTLALEEYYSLQSKVQGALGNYKEAWVYNQKYIDYLGKISKKIEKEQYEQHQIEFEVAEKENQIKKLKITALQKNLLVQKQRNYLLLAGIILFMAVIAFVVFIIFYRTIRNKNKTIEENVAKLEKSVKEKELLLKEIHHRVKNNFQLVTSLLNIQAREVGAKDLDEFIEKGQSRIISMALIHENLYQTDKLDQVHFQDYVTNLVDNIKKTFFYRNDKITTKIALFDCSFDIQTSISLGLIINELYSNILKHAFPDNKGNITIEIIKKDKHQFQLIVADDGVGLNETRNSRKTTGLELVQMLVEQLNGTIELENSNGTKYSINFREIVG